MQVPEVPICSILKLSSQKIQTLKYDILTLFTIYFLYWIKFATCTPNFFNLLKLICFNLLYKKEYDSECNDVKVS